MIDFYMLRPDIVDKQKVENMGGIPMSFDRINLAIDYPSFDKERALCNEAFDQGVAAVFCILLEEFL